MWRRSLWFLLFIAVWGPAQAKTPATFCIFDPVGRSGDVFDLTRQYLQGVEGLTLRPYSNERLAMEDFKAGQCDGVAVSTFRARQLNAFTGSIDAFGGLSETADLRPLFELLSHPAMAPALVQGNVEVAGMIPLGSLFVLVSDRRINSVARAAGRRVAVLDWDPSQTRLVQGLAAQPVAADVSNYAQRFNNGQVDIIAAPVLLFEHLELARGLERGGGIYRFPLGQLTSTLLVRRERFPAGFAEGLRARAPGFVATALQRIRATEASLPAHYWLRLDSREQAHYAGLLATARDQLTREGFYDPRMMAILQRLRCRQSPGNAECAPAQRG